VGKASRDKGKRGEREAALLLRSFGFQAHRAQQFKGSAGSADVTCPELEAVGVQLEVKNTARPTLGPWLDKAEEDAAGKVPVILWKRPRKGWVAILPAEELLRLLGGVPPSEEIDP
jgi:Holliday junction resolvase